LKITPFDYQFKFIEDIRNEYRKGRRSVLGVMPCGSGKTLCFTWIIQQAAARGKRCLVLTHRTELIEQASEKLTLAGVGHGYIMPNRYGELEQVAVASVQTLERRIVQSPINFDLVIADESHREEIMAGVRYFPTAKILGVTATPVRTDGKGLGVEGGGVFESMVVGPTAKELIERGRLIEPEIYGVPYTPDMAGVRTYKGDFQTTQAEERMNKPTITGDAVDHYRSLASHEPAVVFCHSVKHAIAVRDQFVDMGFKFEVVHGMLNKKERARLLAQIADGSIDGITSVDVVTTGTDIPSLAVGLWLRKTKSQNLWIQGCGRIMRTSDGKRKALVLDHANNWVDLGAPHADHDWTLDGELKSKRQNDDVTSVRQCKKCFAVFEKDLICPYCGHKNPPKERRVEEQDGNLEKISKEALEAVTKQKMNDYKNATSWDEMMQIASRRGDSVYWLKKRWGRKFGH
jgi:DNA repair protein RadD